MAVVNEHAPLNLRRVTHLAPCPICGHKQYCGVSADGAVAACMYTDAGSFKSMKGGRGWLHRLDGARHFAPVHVARPTPKLSSAECELIARQCVADLGEKRLAGLANQLGVSSVSLATLRCGWQVQREHYTFPMRDGDGRIIGIRTRDTAGNKKSVKGSRSGLFIPATFPLVVDPSTLMICEGPTDTAAALDLGFAAIGRPDASSGEDLLVAYVRRTRPERLVIATDNDPNEVGWNGADRLARRLVSDRTVLRVRVTLAPDGAKDLRTWKRTPEASHEALAAWIDQPAATEVKL